MATYTGTQKSSSRRQLVVVGLVALAVVLAVGLGGWQLTRHGHSASRTMAIPHGQLHPGDHAEAIPAATSGQLTAASTWPVHAEQPPQLILVGSAAQAQEVQHSIDEGDVIRHTLGLAPLAAQVVQLEAGTPSAAQQAVEDLTVVRHTLGLADAQLVDLRATPPTTDPASSVATTISTAAPARLAIAAENQLRASLGLPELPDVQ
jgi:hypothetical protein